MDIKTNQLTPMDLRRLLFIAICDLTDEMVSLVAQMEDGSLERDSLTAMTHSAFFLGQALEHLRKSHSFTKPDDSLFLPLFSEPTSKCGLA